MPGIVLCGRRWAIGSDDILIPAVILFICHLPSTIWLIVVISSLDYDPDIPCSLNMYEYLIGYLIILLMILILEFMALIVSCRGTIINTKPRKFLQHIIYSRLVLLIVEFCFIAAGSIFLVKFQNKCINEWYDKKMKKSILSIVIGNSFFIMVLLLSINCVYDRAGKSFYKLKIFEQRYKNHPNIIADTVRNLMHRRTLDLYHKNWRLRCTKLFCCIKKPKNQAAFAVISDTLSCFFHKYDIVPSDILAGLLLLSQQQKLNRINVLTQVYLGIDDFMSGVPVTSVTKFIKLNDKKQLEEYEQLMYFFQYAMASYGWPLYAYNTHCACLKLLPNIKYCFCSNHMFSCCFKNNKLKENVCPFDELKNIEIEDDNCCYCYFDGLLRQLPNAPLNYNKNKKKCSKKSHIEIIYASFHSDVEKTPFYVAIDYYYKKIIIAIRGTESLQDAITDMQHHQIKIPGIHASKEWYAHQGMTNAASFIKSELESKQLLERAFQADKEKQTDKFDLLIVGHSLGGGTGAILSILLKSHYPNVKCFTYGPPGALLSEECMMETKSFITTVVVGKDMVTRLGMFQMEKLRNDVMDVLQNSRMPKWQIISGLCCIRNRSNKSQDDQINDINDMFHSTNTNNNSSQLKKISMDSTDCSKVEICYLNSPLPTKDAPNLYPPGRILHIVRQYPRNDCLSSENRTSTGSTGSGTTKQQAKSVFQIIEADNRSFNELLISPRMLQDHMPQSILNAMKAALNDQQLSSNKPEALINVNEINNENNRNNDKIYDLQPLSAKFSRMKKVIFGQQLKLPGSSYSNRQSKAISVCSYENIINFAPLAKQESLSDMTLYDDATNAATDGVSTSLIDNSFRNSILKLRDEIDGEMSTREENEEDYDNEDCNKNTSTPRNSNNNNDNNIELTSPSSSDLNCTSLSMFNNTQLFDSSNNNNNDNNQMIVDLTFSSNISNNSNNNDNNVNNQSFLSDYSSIEKLEILKPKSKDYILCFNTSVDSSINTSSNNNNNNNNESQTEIKTFDSGIDINSNFK